MIQTPTQTSCRTVLTWTPKLLHVQGFGDLRSTQDPHVQKFPKPFFRKSRQCWYVEIRSQQINLGLDRDEAFRRYPEIVG
jgi:hypothetical protein